MRSVGSDAIVPAVLQARHQPFLTTITDLLNVDPAHSKARSQTSRRSCVVFEKENSSPNELGTGMSQIETTLWLVGCSGFEGIAATCKTPPKMLLHVQTTAAIRPDSHTNRNLRAVSRRFVRASTTDQALWRARRAAALEVRMRSAYFIDGSR